MSTPRKVRSVVLGLGLIAAGLVVGSFFAPTTAVEGGGRTLEGWWTAQSGLAIALAAFAVDRRWRRAAFLGSALLVGTAAQLGLTSPLWLQFLEIRPAMLGAGTRPIALFALVVQILTVLVFMRGLWRTWLDGLRHLASRRVMLFGPLIFLFSAAHATIFVPHLSNPLYVAGYLVQLVAVGTLFAINLAHLWLLARALPRQTLARLDQRLSEAVALPGVDRPPTQLDRRLPLLLATFTLLSAVFVAVAVFERAPHIPDEIAYIFQARQLATLALSAPAPPVAEAFTTYLLDTDGQRWWATTNPGWPGALALGAAFGATWLVNPLLAAVAILLLHALVCRLTDRGTANLSTTLAAVSPWLLFLAGSQMTHLLALVMTLAAWLLAHRAAARGALPAALLAGLALGYSVLIRPLDGLLVGVLTAAWLVAEGRRRWRLLGAYSIGSVLGSTWLLPFNTHFTGKPLRDPMTSYLDRLWYPGANRLGFGEKLGPPDGWGNLDVLPGHGPAGVLLNTNQNLYNLNFELHGWAIGSLVLIAAHLLLGRLSRLDRQLGLFCVVLVATYGFYWFSGGPDFGARYWFLLFVPAVIWSARGLTTLARRLGAAFGDPLTGYRLGTVVGFLVAISLVTFCSWRAIGRYYEYRGFHADYLRLLESGTLGRSLVLVETERDSDLGSALFLNHPSLPADQPLFAHDLGPDANRRLKEAFPDRPVIRIRGRSSVSDRVQIRDGPRPVPD